MKKGVTLPQVESTLTQAQLSYKIKSGKNMYGKYVAVTKGSAGLALQIHKKTGDLQMKPFMPGFFRRFLLILLGFIPFYIAYAMAGSKRKRMMDDIEKAMKTAFDKAQAEAEDAPQA